jgi:cyanophycin synthetase
MNILKLRTLDGPNVFHHRPVVVMTLDLEELDGRESREFDGFNERLLHTLPGLHEHVCGKGYSGGFVERLRDGTYFGHVVEHAAIELAAPLGIGGNYGKTVRGPSPRSFDVVVRSCVHAAMRHLLTRAVDGVEALLRGETWDVDRLRAEAQDIVSDTDLGPSTRAIVNAARARGIPWVRLNGQSLVQLGYGRRRRLIESTMAETTSSIAVEVAQDKALTKTLLERAFLPVPRGRTVTTLDAAIAAAHELGGPAVIKPLDGNQGKGVAVGMRSVEEITAAFTQAQQYSPEVIVEETFAGHDYRVLVVGGRMVAASRRSPPCVVGDGVRTVADLVAAANEDPRRGKGHEKPLTQIRLDQTALMCLAKQGLRPDAVPARGREVLLRDSSNLSTGGTATDVTHLVHPSVRALCERAARVIGLDICGVDYVAPDISVPAGDGAGIVELNAGPGIRMHVHPSEGVARDVGAPIVQMLFPGEDSGRIPLISITGTNGKTTVTRMVAHAIGATGVNVGMTTTDGIWIGGQTVATGDMTGPRSAQVVLSDPSVDVAVLETARGGIVRSGLGYDWSDIGVITNIQLDHIGQDGIESLEDLAHIKSLVAERVKPGGVLVLNADDPQVMAVLNKPAFGETPREIRLFSASPDQLHVRRHISRGGIAYYPRNGWIVEHADSEQRRIVAIADMPSALGGVAEFQVLNAMACAAVCRAHGLSCEQVAAALQTFGAHDHNQGRGNLYRVGRGYVLLDYGHNPAAFEAIGQLARRWQGHKVTGIVGLPGDRADWVIEASARVAARAFHRVIVREDEDLRGRHQGELPRFLCETITRFAPDQDCCVVTDEAAALREAVATMQPGEVVVVFYEDLDTLRQTLDELHAVPAARVEPPYDESMEIPRRA